ncbi:major facilitator superfamily domain-containing protein [Dichotomopilus funicola]|uniref:Probable transporter MCH1 n=1 Tax=Dichotomopilus funicola TaxID=1934379 RepID=A0AAN6V429_9PEZI|nr:major facilitator superfamily domain-containing protein [Dichotomopilus funicola]
MPFPPPSDDESAESSPLLRPRSSATNSSTLSPSPSPSSRSSSPARRAARSRARLRLLTSALTALLSALCAGSVTAFSLYAPILQARLRYSQFEVNGLASAASVAMYAPVPLLGYLCDRAGPAPLALLAAVTFGGGYAGAAGAYVRARGVVEGNGGLGGGGGAGVAAEWYVLMVLAFVAIGVGTCCMYMSSVATCAKNFGKGKHRGLAVAVPIAAFGLSGMWMSQVGSHFLLNHEPGAEDGEVDVFKFFVFLAVLLVVVGVLGCFGLRIVDEKDLIEEAVEELERSGILDGSAMFTPGRTESQYGTLERDDPFDELEDAVKDSEEEEARLKKRTVLNAETRRFLTDHTMWCLALGFFFMIGPGEAFMNNMGTVIKTLYPPTLHYEGKPTSPATHVSIVAITSTAARLLTGSLTDLLAPSPKARHVQITRAAVTGHPLPSQRFSVSRVSFLLLFALILSLGLAGLASGFAQDHGDRFWLISGLVGAGYGAVFSLTPIIITVIWGVENFATNWGIVAMFPALGATLWGVVYSAVYQAGVEKTRGGGPGSPGGAENEEDNLCYGQECYAPAFWAMAASVWVAGGLVLFAWKGRNGWSQRGIVV